MFASSIRRLASFTAGLMLISPVHAHAPENAPIPNNRPIKNVIEDRAVDLCHHREDVIECEHNFIQSEHNFLANQCNNYAYTLDLQYCGRMFITFLETVYMTESNYWYYNRSYLSTLFGYCIKKKICE